jgi:hypothetical protein
LTGYEIETGNIFQENVCLLLLLDVSEHVFFKSRSN